MVGSNLEFDNFEDQVCQQVHINLQQHSKQIRKYGTRLVETFRALVTSLRGGHRLPAFRTIANMSENQLRTHIEGGSAERTKLCDEVRKDHKLFESAFTNLVSYLLSDKQTSWPETQKFVITLLTDSTGKTPNYYKVNFEDFVVKHRKISEHFADKKNVIEYSWPSSILENDSSLPLFTGGKNENIYCWSSEVKSLLRASGIPKDKQKWMLRKFLSTQIFETVEHLIRDDSSIEDIFKELKAHSFMPNILKNHQERHKALPIPAPFDCLTTHSQKAKQVAEQIRPHLWLVAEVSRMLNEQAETLFEEKNKDQEDDFYLKGKEKAIRKIKNRLLTSDYCNFIKYIPPVLPFVEHKLEEKIEVFEWVAKTLENLYNRCRETSLNSPF